MKDCNNNANVFTSERDSSKCFTYIILFLLSYKTDASTFPVTQENI